MDKGKIYKVIFDDGRQFMARMRFLGWDGTLYKFHDLKFNREMLLHPNTVVKIEEDKND